LIDACKRASTPLDHAEEGLAIVIGVLLALPAGVSGFVLGAPNSSRSGWWLLVAIPALCGLLAAIPFLLTALRSSGVNEPFSELVALALGAALFIVPLCLLPTPALAVVYAFERRVGTARPGSLLDQRDRRRVWLAAFAVIALGCALAAVLSPRRNPLALVLASCAGSALLVLLCREIAIRLGLRRAAAGAERQERSAPTPGAALLDLGVGQTCYAAATAAGMDPYRTGPPRTLIRGELPQTLQSLDRQLRVLSALLAITLFSIIDLGLRPPAPRYLSRRHDFAFTEIPPPPPVDPENAFR